MAYAATNKGHAANGDAKIVVILSGVGLLVGAVLGLVAMITARAGERLPVFGMAGAGWLMTAFLLVAVALPNYVRARTATQKQAVEDVTSAARDFQRQYRQSPGAGSEEAAVAKLQRAIEAASQKSSGENAKAMKAMSATLAPMIACRTALEKASHELKEARVLYTGNLTNKSQLQERRTLVQNLVAANAQIKKCYELGPVRFRQSLLDAGVSPDYLNRAVIAYTQDHNASLTRFWEASVAEERKCSSMLGALNVLDATWGRWRFDSQGNVLRFDDPPALQQYNRFLEEINSAAAKTDWTHSDSPKTL